MPSLRDEAKSLYDREVDPIVVSLFSGSYFLPEIQRLFSENIAAIRSRYGTDALYLIDDYQIHHVNEVGFSTFRCGVQNSCPQIVILAANLKLAFDQIAKSKSKDCLELFRLHVVVSLMHELDHLATGLVGNQGDPVREFENERLTWARTCENTMRLLVERYNKELYKSELAYYSTWVKCGRNPESEEWKEFIATLYSPQQK